MKCCICRKEAGKYGNNALPLIDGLCCDDCNIRKVVPARLELLRSQQNKGIKEVFKRNALALAKHHRKHCEGEDCDISLFMLLYMATDAGVKFTEKEAREFI